MFSRCTLLLMFTSQIFYETVLQEQHRFNRTLSAATVSSARSCLAARWGKSRTRACDGMGTRTLCSCIEGTEARMSIWELGVYHKTHQKPLCTTWRGKKLGVLSFQTDNPAIWRWAMCLCRHVQLLTACERESDPVSAHLCVCLWMCSSAPCVCVLNG